MNRLYSRVSRLEGHDRHGRRPEVTRVFMARDGNVQERIAEAEKELAAEGKLLLAIVIRDIAAECEANAKQA